MLVLTVPGDHSRRVTICYALLISNAGFYRSRQRHVDSKCSGSADMLFVLREKLKLFLQRGIFSGVQGISSTLALLLLMTLLLPTTCICYIQVFVQYETSFMLSLMQTGLCLASSSDAPPAVFIRDKQYVNPVWSSAN